jgi:hypothetical protein
MIVGASSKHLLTVLASTPHDIYGAARAMSAVWRPEVAAVVPVSGEIRRSLALLALYHGLPPILLIRLSRVTPWRAPQAKT